MSQITLEKLYTNCKQALLKQGGLAEAERDARYILKKRLGIDWSDLIARPSRLIELEDQEKVGRDLSSFLSGKPLSRIYGGREFYGLDYVISAETLDPRIDTELLVDIALKRLKTVDAPRILDLGTGSGCILLSILKKHKGATGLGLDLSFDALKTASFNAKALGLSERAAFVCGRWCESIGEQYDLVVSNPPYIASEVIQTLDESVQKYDPILALDGGKDGMQAYKEIFIHLSDVLKPGGRALFEIGFDQEEMIARLSKESRFLLEGVHRDSGAQPRVAEIIFPGSWG